MSGARYTTRLRAFAQAMNLKPEDVKPGHEFITWINRHWTEFCATHKASPGRNHAAFEEWLLTKYGVKPC